MTKAPQQRDPWPTSQGLLRRCEQYNKNMRNTRCTRARLRPEMRSTLTRDQLPEKQGAAESRVEVLLFTGSSRCFRPRQPCKCGAWKPCSAWCCAAVCRPRSLRSGLSWFTEPCFSTEEASRNILFCITFCPGSCAICPRRWNYCCCRVDDDLPHWLVAAPPYMQRASHMNAGYKTLHKHRHVFPHGFVAPSLLPSQNTPFRGMRVTPTWQQR